MALILISNDDGVYAPGIRALKEALETLGEVWVVAPDRERSATAHALTMDRPLRAETLEERVLSVNGTPTDCVALGIAKLLPGRPDLVVSGINRGQNLGDDITYSGTVAAAIEATIHNVPAIAVSLAIEDRKQTPNYPTAAIYARRAARLMLEFALPFDTLININVPDLPEEEIKGLRYTRQGRRIYEGSIQEVASPWGDRHYWIGGGRPFWEHGEETDLHSVYDGYVSVTPLHLDFTNYEAFEFLENHWKGGMERGE